MSVDGREGWGRRRTRTTGGLPFAHGPAQPLQVEVVAGRGHRTYINTYTYKCQVRAQLFLLWLNLHVASLLCYAHWNHTSMHKPSCVYIKTLGIYRMTWWLTIGYITVKNHTSPSDKSRHGAFREWHTYHHNIHRQCSHWFDQEGLANYGLYTSLMQCISIFRRQSKFQNRLHLLAKVHMHTW